MALPIYSSKDVKVAWIGVPLKGLGPDTFITFSYSNDVTEETIGADGSVEISISPDKTGTCTVTVLQGSEAEKILGLALASVKNAGVLVRGALTVTDPSGSVLALLRGAHIKTPSEVSLGATTEARVWTFFVEDMAYLSTSEEIATKISQTDADRLAGFLSTLIDGSS